MTHITCRLTARYRDQLLNPTLGNRVWATFTFLRLWCSQTACDWMMGRKRSHSDSIQLTAKWGAGVDRQEQ